VRLGRGPKPRDAWLTALTVFLVPSFLALGYWQLTRALGGNTLSWAYTFEWPLFAGYLIYIRWRLLRESAAEAGAGPSPSTAGGPREKPDSDQARADAEYDEELAAYNRYLAALEESGRRKYW